MNTILPYFKQASITPRMKKSNMHIIVLSNYRPNCLYYLKYSIE